MGIATPKDLGCAKSGDLSRECKPVAGIGMNPYASPTREGRCMGVAAGQAETIGAGLVRLRRAACANPAQPQIWRQLADALDEAGDRAGAAAAYLEHVRHAPFDPALMRAAAALHGNDIPFAERLLKTHLKRAPTDVVAMRMLAELAVRLDRCEDAQRLLERCLELAPDFHEARHNCAIVLNRLNRPQDALVELERLLDADSGNPGYRNLKAVALCHTGDYATAIGIYAELLRQYPQQAALWLSYGHALKTAGRQEQAISAYERCIELDADFGDAYWSLANLKTFRFSDAQIAAMRDALARDSVGESHRQCLEFALGKALEDRSEYADSFRHYETGNVLRLQQIPYNPGENTARLHRAQATFSAEFLRARAGSGATAHDPIFIVGLPRAGSTLIEQILASHSRVEGTMELPDIISITRDLRGTRGGTYHEALAHLTREELRNLGEQYLERTRIHRKLGRPFFIDKMPNNFAHVGLIHLILPNAKIIDARRHPLACCFSGFKQHFAHGQNFTYGLNNIGRYFRDYVEWMRHVDTVLPGRVHRVIYEEMVTNTEHEVRRLLDYCGLPFEQACLRFFENERPVRTASSEQVRQPIYQSGVDHWQHYQPWLDPLKQALGPALTDYAG
ncbi:MAG: sulfotransferase [Proteobacteria bacterium]|nr:sulfotransferase [Pseudomonadota bacterium]